MSLLPVAEEPEALREFGEGMLSLRLIIQLTDRQGRMDLIDYIKCNMDF